ncbi:hypothetical protein D1831_11950 [Lactiplantibacillus garii]|uniref:Uncharacterized protein n=1 Tax=Lactiplantibacillus garii TaxID=2306423 RepID=A0A3R8J5C8_9LACO|nr:hypothetical protein [Lactiplantibacillus garii]RRK09582.1 hypothetical protein D1831_11950 [Lactiplantibacillus garii]
MAPLPAQFNTCNQFMALETCLHAVVHDGFDGFQNVKLALVDELARLLDARITILLDQPQFVLIIHNHREKLAVLGNVQPGSERRYDITLDGHSVNSGPELMDTIYNFL